MKKILSLFSLLALFLIGGANQAVADYYVGERLTVSEVQDGDFVIFEAASSTVNYGYYIQETPDGYFWKEGLGDNCVWRLISTGDANTYYFQNVCTGNYISGNGYTVANCKTVSDQASAAKIKLNGWNSSWYKYTNYPQGWDENSIIISMVGGGNYGNRLFDDAKINGTFNRDGLHCDPYNIFKVSTSTGIPFSSMTNTTEAHNGVVVNGLTYNLSTALLTPTGQLKGNSATLTTANQNLTTESVHIPATVTYSGVKYNVTKIETEAFQHGEFSTLTFESPCNFTSIGNRTFYNCNNVKRVELPEGLTTLGAWRSFSTMASLTEIMLPESITSIQDHSFSTNPSLEAICFKSATPPSIGTWDVFGDGTKPTQIYIVVPNEAAVEAYTTALSTAYPSLTFKGIITMEQYVSTLKEKLQTAINIGVGLVCGIKDNASLTAAKTLLAGTPTKEELQYALDNYILNFVDGYYRIVYPYYHSGNSGDNYLRFGNDLMLYADVDFADLSDYSTVFKAQITSTTESRAAGKGYRMILTSQGLRPTDTGYDTHQAMAAPESQFAIAIRHSESLGEFLFGISNASAEYTDTRYIYKKPADENKKIHSYAGNVKAARAKIYSATDITVALHKVGNDYWATLYVPFGVTLPEGTEAFVGAVDGDVLRLTSIGQDIPANTAVVLKGDAASITATINDDIAAYEGSNALVGHYLAASAANDNIRALGTKSGVIGFYKLNSALGANKAYLDMSSTSPGFRIVIDDDNITGIQEFEGSNVQQFDSYFDLQGRKVAAPQKGHLYIVNGKTVLY